MKLDKHGYAPSILQSDLSHCYLCGRTDRKLDRHEIFPGIYRNDSKKYGLWIMLCHSECHEGKNGAQFNRQIREDLSDHAQHVAMLTYGWDMDEWRRHFGKNWRRE